MEREEAREIKGRLLRELKRHPPGDPRDTLKRCMEILNPPRKRKATKKRGQK